ncbi:MAG: FtsQ-type POTRA domain-containing protein [bacterium]|nr:FtsQ-type POTRA domain-containing protein [bacterium]
MREKLIEEKKKRIKKWLYIFLLLIIICLIISARILLPRLFVNISLFSLKNVIIEPSNYGSFLREYLSIPEGISLFSIDMAEIYSKLKQIYFVDDCRIEKHLPDTLVIKVKIRSPWVVIVDGNSSAIMDRNGYFLPFDENFNGWIVEGIKIETVGKKSTEKDKVEILKDIEQWYNYYGVGNLFRIDSVSLKDLDKIELKSGDRTIYIYKEEINKQLEVAKKVLYSCGKNNFPFEYIDVRFKEPYVKEKIAENHEQ